MNEFNKFKKKVLLEHLIRCLIISVSTFLIVFGILFILSKREIIPIHWWLDLIIGLASGVVLFGIIYPIFRPNDVKIATRIDETFKLGEKVQTMLVHKDDESVIAQLQREGTSNKLNEITTKKLKIKLQSILFIVLLVGLVTTITSVAIPGIVHEEEIEVDPDPEYSTTEWQILQIKKLIEYVNNSKMNDTMKASYINELNLLIDGLKVATKNSQMISNVLTTCTNINLIMMKESTNKKLGKTLKGIGNYNLICKDDKTEYELKENAEVSFVIDSSTASTASLSFIPVIYMENGEEKTLTHDPIIVNVEANEEFKVEHKFTALYSGKYHIDVPEGTYLIETTGTSTYQLLASAANTYSASTASDVLLAIQKKYIEAYDKSANACVYMLKKDIENLKSALEATELESDSNLYLALSNYITALESATKDSVFKLTKNITTALDGFEPTVISEISEKCENRDVAWYIEDELRKLFGLPEATGREDSTESSQGQGSQSDPQGSQDFGGGGGMGDGEFIYSSTDLIYDYENNKLVAYGNLYDSYYAIVNGLINEGQLTEEMVNYINAYYSYLLKVNNE